jgi:acetoin utilization protein AcuB
MRLELVKDWMTRDVITVLPGMGLLEADKVMREREIRRLPVVDENGRLRGIVTYGDVRGARPSTATSLSTWEISYLLANLTIADVMNESLLTVTPETTVGEAAQLMMEKKVSGLPVISGGELVGIITESDIFRMVVHNWVKMQKGSTSPFAHYSEDQ